MLWRGAAGEMCFVTFFCVTVLCVKLCSLSIHPRTYARPVFVFNDFRAVRIGSAVFLVTSSTRNA